jgi:hypothetical protein
MAHNGSTVCEPRRAKVRMRRSANRCVIRRALIPLALPVPILSRVLYTP